MAVIPKTVLIGTLTFDGRLDVRYVSSLMRTLFDPIRNERQVNLWPDWVCQDASVVRGRNHFFKVVMDNPHVTDLVFIDSDHQWDSAAFYRLLEHDADVVGATYRKRNLTKEDYVLLGKEGELDPREDGLLEVRGLGCGFLRFRRAAVEKMWEAAKPYDDDGRKLRMIFEHKINGDGCLQSEDITACELWRSIGGKVFLDTKLSIDHFDGPVNFPSNFLAWYEPVREYIKEKGWAAIEEMIANGAMSAVA